MFTDRLIKGAWERPCDQVEVENEALHNARDGCNSQLSTELVVHRDICSLIFFFFTIFTTWNFLLCVDPGD